jgi:hypothetical protein
VLLTVLVGQAFFGHTTALAHHPPAMHSFDTAGGMTGT